MRRSGPRHAPTRREPNPRPQLLFLSHRLPYPPHNGAAIRTHAVLQLLARRFDITALCFDRHDPALQAMPVASRLDALAPIGAFEVYPIPQDRRPVRRIWDHLRSIATGRVYTHFVHDSRRYEQRLQALLTRECFDLVHIDSLDLVRFLPLAERLPVVLTHHNVESLLLRRRAASERRPLARRYLEVQARWYEEAERTWLPRVALNVTVSDEDAAVFRAMVPGARVLTVPNGVDVTYFRPPDVAPSPEGCVFVGGTTWYPNRDALEWFTAEVLPRFRETGEEAPVTWVGRTTEAERARYATEGFHLTGYVDDVRPFMASARCFVVPLRIGGGTRLKILDAWAMGCAVVSTSIGCEGLDARDGQNILIADSATEFVAAMRRVLHDAVLRRRLQRGARATAEATYSWEAIARHMLSAYEAFLPGGAPVGASDEAQLPLS